MSISISTNVNSLKAQEYLRANTGFQAGVIQRLTSGYRFSRAADDPTGLATDNKMRASTNTRCVLQSGAPHFFSASLKKKHAEFITFQNGPK